ncbi:MAG TPA: hypothetical protein VFR85_02905 [Anaeromyxobacteraceae bacterium]|nr:hypothetical protein [Anaeromyxobacteraceae bacterium]
MTLKFSVPVAAALALAAVPALAYEESFVAPVDRDPAPTVVQVEEYSEGYFVEAAGPQHRQIEPVVAGNYTEQFIETGAPASGAKVAARSKSAPARASATR